MPDQPNDTSNNGPAGDEPNEPTTETGENGGEPSGTEGQEPEGSNEPDPKPEDELPEWARKELTKVRGEAANYRTKLRDAETRLKDAKTPEEVEAARAELSEKVAELEKQVLVGDVARKYKLPDELAVRLRGATKDELEADAKALQKFAVEVPPADLSGGLDPSDTDSEPDDPAALARKYGRGRRNA